jgi:hypothetical protein
MVLRLSVSLGVLVLLCVVLSGGLVNGAIHSLVHEFHDLQYDIHRHTPAIDEILTEQGLSIDVIGAVKEFVDFVENNNPQASHEEKDAGSEDRLVINVPIDIVPIGPIFSFSQQPGNNINNQVSSQNAIITSLWKTWFSGLNSVEPLFSSSGVRLVPNVVQVSHTVAAAIQNRLQKLLLPSGNGTYYLSSWEVEEILQSLRPQMHIEYTTITKKQAPDDDVPMVEVETSGANNPSDKRSAANVIFLLDFNELVPPGKSYSYVSGFSREHLQELASSPNMVDESLKALRDEKRLRRVHLDPEKAAVLDPNTVVKSADGDRYDGDADGVLVDAVRSTKRWAQEFEQETKSIEV